MQKTVLRARPWLHSFYAVPIPPLMTREEFVAKYLPKYSRPYVAPMGIRLDKQGRPVRSTPGSYQAQVTKRENTIAEVYAAYCSDHSAMVEMDRKSSEPELF